MRYRLLPRIVKSKRRFVIIEGNLIECVLSISANGNRFFSHYHRVYTCLLPVNHPKYLPF